MKTIVHTIALTGSAGAASGSASTGIYPSRLHAIQVKYHSQPATTDVVVKCVLDGVEKTILTLTDNNVDLPLQSVGEPVLDNVGAPTAVLIPPRLAGEVRIAVAQGDPDAAGVTVVLLVE